MVRRKILLVGWRRRVQFREEEGVWRVVDHTAVVLDGKQDTRGTG